MSSRRRHATPCTRCGIRRTHHTSRICAICRGDIPIVERLPEGLVILGQLKLSEPQARQLADTIHDVLEGEQP